MRVEGVGGVVKRCLYIHTVEENVFEWVWCVCTVKCASPICKLNTIL